MPQNKDKIPLRLSIRLKESQRLRVQAFWDAIRIREADEEELDYTRVLKELMHLVPRKYVTDSDIELLGRPVAKLKAVSPEEAARKRPQRV